jgi:hypothetical protein
MFPKSPESGEMKTQARSMMSSCQIVDGISISAPTLSKKRVALLPRRMRPELRPRGKKVIRPIRCDSWRIRPAEISFWQIGRLASEGGSTRKWFDFVVVDAYNLTPGGRLSLRRLPCRIFRHCHPLICIAGGVSFIPSFRHTRPSSCEFRPCCFLSIPFSSPLSLLLDWDTVTVTSQCLS